MPATIRNFALSCTNLGILFRVVILQQGWNQIIASERWRRHCSCGWRHWREAPFLPGHPSLWVFVRGLCSWLLVLGISRDGEETTLDSCVDCYIRRQCRTGENDMIKLLQIMYFLLSWSCAFLCLFSMCCVIHFFLLSIPLQLVFGIVVCVTFIKVRKKYSNIYSYCFICVMLCSCTAIWSPWKTCM